MEEMSMSKNILSLTPRTKKLWSKKTKERTNIDYILIAELSNQKEIFFASNVKGEIEKQFNYNGHQELKEILITREKSTNLYQLELAFLNGESCKLEQKDFTLLVSCPYYDDSGKERRDSLFCFCIPEGINSTEIKQCYIPNDQKAETAFALFMLISLYVGGNE